MIIRKHAATIAICARSAPIALKSQICSDANCATSANSAMVLTRYADANGKTGCRNSDALVGDAATMDEVN